MLEPRHLDSAVSRGIISFMRAPAGSVIRLLHQSKARPGRAAARLPYSANAGFRNMRGLKRISGWSPVMKMRHISAVPKRFTRPAARKAPELTPT